MNFEQFVTNEREEEGRLAVKVKAWAYAPLAHEPIKMQRFSAVFSRKKLLTPLYDEEERSLSNWYTSFLPSFSAFLLLPRRSSGRVFLASRVMTFATNAVGSKKGFSRSERGNPFVAVANYECRDRSQITRYSRLCCYFKVHLLFLVVATWLDGGGLI